jgi:hypothetical protein
MLDPIECRRHRASRKARSIGQCAGGHGAGLRQHAETPQIRAIQSQTLGDRLVDLVGRVLEYLNTSPYGGQELVLHMI